MIDPRYAPARDPEPQPQPLALAERVRVAFQGEPGSFSHEAVRALWGDAAEPVPCRTFAEVTEAAESRRVHYGVLPLESTLLGAIDSAYDLLALHETLSITAEIVLPVQLALLGLPGATLESVRTAESHPVVLGQIAYFLDRYRHLQPVRAFDTAGAAREIAEAQDPTRAAVASPAAAAVYGLTILASHLEDRPDSQLRFLVVAPEPEAVAPGTPVRTALWCEFANTAGALVSALAPLGAVGMNVSHLVSRPTREPWRYQFFVEVEHLAGEERVAHALAQLRARSSTSRILGTYARWMRGESALLIP